MLQHRPKAPTISLTRKDLQVMRSLVKQLYALSQQKSYRNSLNNSLPTVAQFNPHHDSVLMGYDFHLSNTGPKLIEVNTNAGGLWLSYLAHYPDAAVFSGHLAQRLLTMFLTEFRLWRGLKQSPLKTLAILDENPTEQFLYAEMQAFASLLKQQGINTVIVAPQELHENNQGLYFQNKRIDMIYNRHCDFYLETLALQAIRNAYLEKKVCLSPNPFSYGLLADKRRMINWSALALDPDLNELTAQQRCLLQQTIPATHLLATENRQKLWQDRKAWVFKPVNAYASRGVYLGKKLTTGKFTEFDSETTLVQEFIEPSTLKAANGQEYKVDFRLFVYQAQILSVAARVYQGQVTNLRTEGGGCARIVLN